MIDENKDKAGAKPYRLKKASTPIEEMMIVKVQSNTLRIVLTLSLRTLEAGELSVKTKRHPVYQGPAKI